MPKKKNQKQPNNNNNKKKNMTDLLYFRKICSLESLKNIDIWFSRQHFVSLDEK